MISSVADIPAAVHDRELHYHSSHNLMTTLLRARNGVPPAEYERLFNELMPRFNIPQIRTAHDDLTNMAAKAFAVNVKPKKQTAKAKDDAARVESVVMAYRKAAEHRLGGLDHDDLKKKICFHKILCGDAVVIVMPDNELKSPFFHFRDPRTHLPPKGWGPWSPVGLNHTAFVRHRSLDELRMDYRDKRLELARFDRSIASSGHFSRGDGARPIRVVEWYSDETWIVCAYIGDEVVTLTRIDQGDKDFPGVCPVVAFTEYDGINPKGRPALADQLPLEGAASKMLTQQIEAMDAIIHPVIAHTEVEGGELKRGWGQTNQYVRDPQGGQPKIDKIAPDSPLPVLSAMNFLLQWGRVITRNPESMQGQGDADSAKAINALRAGVEGWVQDGLWPDIRRGEHQMYALAIQMDMNLWGNVRKEADDLFEVSYTPAVHLKGFERSVRLKQGWGLGGHIGEVQRLQKLGAGVMTKEQYAEEDPNVEDPRAHIKALQIERLVELQYSIAEAQAPTLKPDAIPKVVKLMQEQDMEWLDAWQELSRRGELTQPPPPEVAQAGGLPPLEALLGGGQDPLAQGAVPGGDSIPAMGQMRAAIG